MRKVRGCKYGIYASKIFLMIVLLFVLFFCCCFFFCCFFVVVVVVFFWFFSDLMDLPLTVDEYLSRVHKEHDRLFPTVPLLPGYI